MYDTYPKSGSERKVRRRIQRKLQDVPITNIKAIHKMENKLRDGYDH
jgi:hypothetical protein